VQVTLGRSALVCAILLLVPGAAHAAAPQPVGLSGGWQVRDTTGDPAARQPPPPQEGTGGPAAGTPSAGPTRDPSQFLQWHGTTVPSVFDTTAVPRLYPGEVRRYRLTFTGPRTPPGFGWRIAFEEVRRAASVYLNGRHLGTNRDPYTPFAYNASGLQPGKTNELLVVVDNRKDPRLPEGWWNWGGIVRPVSLVPVGSAFLDGLGTLSRVRCAGPASSCDASLLLDGVLTRRGPRRIYPTVNVRLRAPDGRVIRRKFKLPRQRAPRRRYTLAVKVPAPKLWSPDAPNLYSARIELRDHGALQQVVTRRVGLRSVQVKGGLLYLNNRRLQLRGASIHEDMPGHGAALTVADMNEIVHDLKDLGANVTRAHYLLSDRLLSKLDRAGIMVWNEAPIWQRDRLLSDRSQRKRALLTVRRTVTAGRNHPAVITHSVGNELALTPDNAPATRGYLIAAARYARNIDPTLPVSLDIVGRPGLDPQFTYDNFDMLGINQYFGWYGAPDSFNDLEPYLNQMRADYPDQALVMTEFGAEARAELADAPPEKRGGYAFQAAYAGQTLDLVDRLPFLSGAIYWTLREFEIFPGWSGGAGRRPPQFEPNTRHQKGLLTYEGQKKPAWSVVHDHFARIPLYATVARR
jgi:beta-glucuronidase